MPLLTGKTADLVAAEIVGLQTIDDCVLIAWCVMPDHVHILLKPPEGRISEMIKRVKGRTGKRLKPGHPEMDRFWERRFGDRRLRRIDEVVPHAEYIEMNPVKAGLCDNPSDWPWSSAHFR